MPLPLETERLVIRPYRDGDAAGLHDVFGSPEVMRWTPSPPSKDVAETAQRLARTMAFTERQPPGLGLWALDLRASGEFLGQVGLFPVEGKGPDVEVAYELAPRAWGHGYATEAARALIDYGFAEMGLARIVALILADNTRSRRVAEKCAMTLEGPGRFYGLDLLVYARSRKASAAD
ncbi:MAG TPA: GNAT family N-acetyltransferase [Candidatus Limnocylindria bacterium]|nr:GNAT family N-acetyltransferase [Candidatus Limnocylindria bacterium]